MIWFLFGLILFTIILNKLSLDYGFKNLNYKMEIEKHIVEIGEEIPIRSTIENNKALTISFLKVEERFPKGFNEEKNIYTLFVMPYQRVKRKYSIVGERRGNHKFRDIFLEIGDFTGFSRIFKEEKINEKIIVLPRKMELKDTISPVGDLYGDISVNRWIIDDPLMTVGIREYNLNDPEKYVHWPSSVKYNQLMVKKFDFTTDNSIMILLNIESTKPYWKDIKIEKIERAIEITRAVIEECEEAKIPYGFASNAYNKNTEYNTGYFYPSGLGEMHKMKFLELLASIDYVISSDFENSLRDISRRQGNYNTVVVITPSIMDSYISSINMLNNNVAKTIVISADEENLDRLNKNISTFRGELE